MKIDGTRGRIVDIEQGNEKSHPTYLIQDLHNPKLQFLLIGPLPGLSQELPIGTLLEYDPRGLQAEAVQPFRKTGQSLPVIHAKLVRINQEKPGDELTSE